MGKKTGAANPNTTTTSEQKEGYNLLGSPTFEPLDNGRFKCVETGHELPAHSRDSYTLSKHCRLGLIDSAVARNKPPLNMFRQDPVSRSKLICKLTGVTINKSEEHIWKHMNGKRFLNMLEKKEAEKEMQTGQKGKHDEENEGKRKKKNEDDELKKKKKKNEDGELKKKKKKNEDGELKKKKKKNEDGELKKKKKKTTEVEKTVDEVISEARDSIGEDSNSGEDVDFWMPPMGNRWDHDDGGDRWDSGSESDGGAGEEDARAEEADHEARELSKRAKRMPLEIGPSSFASRKKKKKLSAAS